jgi:ABC-type multidrug transport system ATPase subunit
VAITNQLIQETLDRAGTVFMTTHDRDKATQIATRGGILKGGHLQLLTSEQLTTDAIF